MIFNVTVKDKKSRFIYCFSLKAESPNKALFFVEKYQDQIYEKASDEGIVNLSSDFLDDNPKIEIQKVLNKRQKYDISIGKAKFFIKKGKLVNNG